MKLDNISKKRFENDAEKQSVMKMLKDIIDRRLQFTHVIHNVNLTNLNETSRIQSTDNS